MVKIETRFYFSLESTTFYKYFLQGLDSSVREYLEQHLHKQFVARPDYIQHSAMQRIRRKNVATTGPPASSSSSQNGKRKLSYKGSIRRTRSIQVENLSVADSQRSELPSIQSSRAVSPVQSLSPDNDGENPSSTGLPEVRIRTPSPERDEPWVMFTRHRTQSDAQYEHTDVRLSTSY